MRPRVCSFTGPIFSADDREFRTIQVPGRFFKIAVWADEEGRPLAVVGTVKDVLARLERGPAAKRAKRAPAR
jgi:endonuclease G, mitochondrial